MVSLEARHKDAEVISEVELHSAEQADCIINQRECQIKLTKMWSRDTVWFDEDLANLLEMSTKL